MAVISAGFAAFVDEVEDTLLRDYVLKQDFTRETQSIHHKLDRIWEFMVNQNR
jgi:phosphoserine phosphatase